MLLFNRHYFPVAAPAVAANFSVPRNLHLLSIAVDARIGAAYALTSHTNVGNEPYDDNFTRARTSGTVDAAEMKTK